MLSVLRILAGVFSAIFALPIFALGVLVATVTEHEVRPFERKHLDAAVRFIRDRETATGTIPEVQEFEHWKLEMDSKGHYQFEGGCYYLDRRCGSKPSDFCISFSTGEAFVTYHSWQESMKKVHLNDSPLLPALGIMAVGLVAAIASKLLLVGRNT